MSTPFALLGLVEYQPSYGYDIKQLYDQLFGQDKPLAFGQVYATLARLKRDGKINMVGQEQGGGPERLKYQITDQGQQDLHHWLLQPEEPIPFLQATLFLKTVLSLLLDNNARQYLHQQQAAHLQRMHQLTLERQQAPLARKLLADHAIFHLEADLRWIDVTTSRLDQLKHEIKSASKANI